MRTRQPWDKTGTKQIHCLKLTSKHFAFEVNYCAHCLKFEVLSTREDYISLYVDTVKKTAVKEDPSRFFVVSRLDRSISFWLLLSLIYFSPSNGVASEEAGYIAENPQSTLWGDNHHYDYKWSTFVSQEFSFFWCLQFSGRITGSGKTTRRLDLHRSMDFRRFQRSRCWNRWLGLLLSNDEI